MPDIDNMTFFRIVDKLVRKNMQQVETELLPVAREALKDSALPLGEFPVEGYYGKTSELKEFFNHIRTLQTEFSDKQSHAIELLHKFYSHDVFGLGQAVRTAISPEGAWYPREPAAVISPRVDPLTVALTKAVKGPATVKQDLTIGNVGSQLEDADLGVGLVGLGVLVDRVEQRKDGRYNPIATTLARETTVLSAYVPTMRSLSQYLVDPEVEEQGNRVIDAYNSVFATVLSGALIPPVRRSNAFSLNNDLPEMQRCVRIYNVDIPGFDKEFYHWAIGSDMRGMKVIDFWRNEVVTTDMFKADPGRYQG